MFDSEPVFRPRVKDFRFGQPVIGDLPRPFPCGSVSVAALFKFTPPEFRHTFPEYHERLYVRWHRVIIEEAPDYLLQPSSLFGDGMVSSPVQLFPDLPEFRPDAVAPSLPF
jgi:hypothetical protein